MVLSNLLDQRQLGHSRVSGLVTAQASAGDGLQVWLRPGRGGYAFNVTGIHTTRGIFLVLEPARRLVYMWLFDHVEPPLPTTVEVTLPPLGRGTRVRLRHHGFVDQPTRNRHAAGWANYLPRLVVAAAGGEPGADEWRTALLLPTEA